jgi:hypothetical protein
MASKFQSKIIKEYQDNDWYVINLIRTNKPGLPDLVCFKEGSKPIFIECKEKTDTLKPLQAFRIKELKQYGVDAVCLQDK